MLKKNNVLARYHEKHGLEMTALVVLRCELMWDGKVLNDEYDR